MMNSGRGQGFQDKKQSDVQDAGSGSENDGEDEGREEKIAQYVDAIEYAMEHPEVLGGDEVLIAFVDHIRKRVEEEEAKAGAQTRLCPGG